MLLYYIRHGDPVYEPDGLTELGKKQAEALSKRLCILGFDEIYCSTSKRAMDTAAPTCEKLNIKPVLLDWTNECHAWRDLVVKAPDGNGMTWVWNHPDYIKAFNSEEVKKLGFEWFRHEYFKGYDFERGITRIERETDRFMLSLGYEHIRKISGYKIVRQSEKRIALFAHQGFGMAFFASLMDIPYPYFSTHFDFGRSSVTVINFDNEKVNSDSGEKYVFPKILQLSNDSHLYKENVLTGYQNVIDV